METNPPKDPQYDPDSFYPYRVQQDTTVEQPTHSAEPTPPEKPKRPSVIIIVLVILALCMTGIIIYNRVRRQQLANSNTTPTSAVSAPSFSPTPSFTPVPTQKIQQFSQPALQTAYNNTISATSLRTVFNANVKTHTIEPTTQADQQIDSKVEGYLVGNTDGNTIQTELRITYAGDASRTAFFGQILVGEQLFLKTISPENKWVERDKSDYNKLYENQPIDATAYAYNMLDTLFSDSKALLRGIDAASVQQNPDEVIDGKTLQSYNFSLLVPDYIQALKSDPRTTKFTLEDAEKILPGASVAGKLFVDPSNNYITRIQFTGNRFTQITTEQAHLLGITASHDMEVLTILSDFNVPITLQAPAQGDMQP